MTMPLTDNADIKVWQELERKITPLNIPVSAVAPPPTRVDLAPFELQELGLLGSFEFIQPSRRRTRDVGTHQALLEESLREYRDIWRTLAER